MFEWVSILLLMRTDVIVSNKKKVVSFFVQIDIRRCDWLYYVYKPVVKDRLWQLWHRRIRRSRWDGWYATYVAQTQIIIQERIHSNGIKWSLVTIEEHFIGGYWDLIFYFVYLEFRVNIINHKCVCTSAMQCMQILV